MRQPASQGLQIGIKKGIEQGIEALIETCSELGVSREDTLHRLEKKFNLPHSLAKEHLDRYWK